MTLLFPDPALRLLARRKLRGTFRRQLRKLKTPKGAILTILGVLLFGLWISSIVLHVLVDSRAASDPEELRPFVGFGILLLTVLSLSGALVHRGLYMPQNEIERLFSAPVSRADLVRYRLAVNFGRSLFGAVVVGLLTMRHMPRPGLAFVGVFLCVQTIPILNQLLAILSGSFERSIASRLKLVRNLVFVAVLLLVVSTVPMLILGEDHDPAHIPVFGELGRRLADGDFRSLVDLPAVGVLLGVVDPWVRMITAQGPGEFLSWFGVCLAIFILFFELTARLPLDFRELSLETSANVAARLRRARRGGGAAAGKVSASTVGWRIPWLFGRSSFGAVAWRKTGAIIRKAKGTLFVSAIVLIFVTLLSTAIEANEGVDALLGPVLIAVLGTLYLCAGLRFDFRDELDRMEVIKAWPLSPSRLFTAMLLPEVCLVSTLLMTAVFVRALMGGGLHPGVFGIIALLPLVVLAWIALDNAVFLFAPVRFVPGQEGALQNAGRGMIMMLVRLVLIVLVGGFGGGAALLAFYVATNPLDLDEAVGWAIAGAVSWIILLLVDLTLLWLGGWTFRRFDVARDRG